MQVGVLDIIVAVVTIIHDVISLAIELFDCEIIIRPATTDNTNRDYTNCDNYY